MFLLRQILSSFLSLSTTNSLIEIYDNFFEQDFAEIQNIIFSSRRTWQVAFDATMANADFPIKNLSSRCLLVLLLSDHQLQNIQTKNCSDLSSSDIENQKTQKWVGEVTRFKWKSQSPMLLSGQFLSVFSCFLGTTSPIKTSDNFPEPRARFAEVQIFVLFSHLSGFLNFLTTDSPIGTFESFTEQDFVEIQNS